MLQPSNSSSGIEPVPWPIPVGVDSNTEEEVEDVGLETSGKDQKHTLQVADKFRNKLAGGKVSRAVYQKIYELYPECIDDVLDEAQIPTMKPSSFQLSPGSGTEAIPTNNGSKEELILFDEAATAERPEYLRLVPDIEVKSRFSNQERPSRFDEEQVPGSFDENLTDTEDAEMVHLITSLGDLFREDSEFLTANTSLSAENAFEESTSLNSIDQLRTEVGNWAPEDPANARLPAHSSNTRHSTLRVENPSEDIHGKKSDGCAQNDVSKNDNEEQCPSYAFKNRSYDLPPTSIDHEQNESIAVQQGTIISSSKSEKKSLPAISTSKPVLRRPIASRRQRVVNIPPLSRHIIESSGSFEEENKTPSEEPPYGASEEITSRSKDKSKTAINETPKGVIMRGFSDYKQVRGIRRAETGLIMSREELNATTTRKIPENPIPKSLRPPIFLDEYDDVPSLTPSSFQKTTRGITFSNSATIQDNLNGGPQSGQIGNLFPLSPSKRDEGGGGSNNKLKKLFAMTPTKPDEGHRSGGRSLLSITPVKYDGEATSGRRRSMFSLSPAHKSKVSGIDFHGDENDNSSKLSEAGDSSGIIGRLGFGLRRATQGMGRKSSTDVTENGKICTIVIPGSIDEAVCKVCVICRNTLNYEVIVRESGRKVKVQSRDESRREHFRATIQIRELHGAQLRCSINIRPTRSDGMKTSSEALWGLYQTLEQEL